LYDRNLSNQEKLINY